MADLDFETVVLREEKAIRKFMRSRLPREMDESAIDDAYQEYLISAYRNWHKFRGESRISTWLHKIATSKLYNHIRRESRHIYQRPLEDPASHWQIPEPVDIEHAHHQGEVVEHLVSHLSTLPQSHQKILSYVVFRGLTAKQIAKKTGLTTGTVSTYLYSMRKFLRSAAAALREEERS